MSADEAAPDPTIQLVTVLETADFGLIAVAQSVLEEAGIDYTVPGETLRNILGWGVPGVLGVNPARIEVREADATRALALLERLTGSTDRPETGE